MTEGRRRTYVVIELIIVTTGILIALSIDGIRQSMADRRLVAEARANLATEIRGNIEELRRFVDGSATHLDNLSATRDVVREVLNGKPLRTESLEVGVTFPTLSSTSRRSTQITGAFGLMPYDEVARYERAYSLQDNVEAMLAKTFELLAAAVPPGAPDELSRRELEVVNEALNQLIASLYLQQNLAPQLLRRYQDALGEAAD
jgi:hypothetical protein